MISLVKDRLKEKECIRIIAMVVIFQAAVCLYFYTRGSESFDSYLSVLIPSLLLMIGFTLVGFGLGGDKPYITICLIMIAIGNSIQVLVGKYTAVRFITIELMAFMIAVIGTVVCLFFQTRIKSEVQYVCLCFVITLMYMLMLLAGKEINGTKAWIYVGSISVQLTEITKLLTLVCFGSVLSSKRRTDIQKLLMSGSVLVLNILGLILVHELGTAIVLCIVFLTLVLLYFKKIKYFLYIAGTTFSCAIGGGLVLKISDKLYQAGNHFVLVRYGEYLHSKMMNRIFLFRAYETDPYGKGYQMMMARKALSLCRWFRSPYDNLNIPVQEADYVFVALLLKFGLIMGLLVLLLLLTMNALGLKIGVLNEEETVLGVTVSGFAMSMLSSSLLTIFGSTNYFLLFGLPIVFLSAGGSSQLATFIMVLYTICTSGKIRDNVKVRRVSYVREIQ